MWPKLLDMRQRRVQLLSAISGCVVAAGLAACTSSGGSTNTFSPAPPSTTPTSHPTSASPTPTRTGPATTGRNVRPGEEPPVLTVEAKKHNADGALFFAQYYMRAKDWSLATMDTYLIKQISLPTCTTCKDWEDAIDKYAKQGAYARGGRLTIGASTLVTGVGPIKSDYVVDIKYSQAADVIVYPTGPPSTDLKRTVDGGSYVFVSWGGVGWRIVEEESDS